MNKPYKHDTTATVVTTYKRTTAELRVQFASANPDLDGFSLAELDALEHAIQHARNRLAAAQVLTFEALHNTQLAHMTPVPS